MEQEYEEKLEVLVNTIVKYKLDVVALQEIMQPIEGKNASYSHINCGKIPLKNGNHALNIVKALEQKGLKYNLAWVGYKKSYGMFDEGSAILTPHEVTEAEAVTLTPFDDYNNWKTRRAIGVKIFGQWFYSVHFGWWDSFGVEWESLTASIADKGRVWLMGDFNSIAAERGKGYDLVVGSGWHDTYALALNKDNGITASTSIDGWSGEKREIRIDYIFTNEKTEIDSSFVIFNEKNEKVISDHFGIILTTRKEN